MWRLTGFLYLLSGLLWASEPPIRAWNQMLDHPNPIVMMLLQRALELTEPEFGHYQLDRSMDMEQGRAIRALQSGGIDIAVFAPDAERERTLLAIPVPIAKGLLGWRVCLIRPDSTARFSTISSLAEWQESGLRIGQLQTWPDTALLRSNGLKVEETALYGNLFKMLHKGRFDCFLRSVIEVEDELSKHPDLIIEPHLVFRYPLPLLYFVSPARPELARRIELGLQRARERGDYDRIFEEGVGAVIRRLGLDRRTVIELHNPDLSPTLRRIIDAPEFSYQVPVVEGIK